MKKYISFLLLFTILLGIPCFNAYAEQDNPSGLTIYGASPRLVEPWGIMFAMTSDEKYDLAQAEDYGMIVLAQNEYDSLDSKETELLVQNKNATVIHKENITYSNGYYIGCFDEGLYTYQFDKEYAVIPFILDDGEYLHGKVHTDSMLEIIKRTKNNKYLTDDIAAILGDMIKLHDITSICYKKDNILSVNEANMNNVKRGSAEFANTVFSGTDKEYSVYLGSSPRTCEPWGIRFVTTYNDIDSLDDFGTIVIEANENPDYSKPTEIITNPNAYIFSHKDGTLEPVKDSDYYYSVIEGTITTYSMDKEYYCYPYVVTKDGNYILGDTYSKTSLKDTITKALSSNKLTSNKEELLEAMLQYHNDAKVVFAAEAKPLTYTVSYNYPDDAYNVPATQFKFLNVPLVLNTQPPIRNGYLFLGWSTSEDAMEVDYLCGEQYFNNSDLTLYAVWQKDDEDYGGGTVKP